MSGISSMGTKMGCLMLFFLALLNVVVGANSKGFQIGVLKSIPEAECQRKTVPGDVVEVHYRGELEDGTVFDSSYERGQPISFGLGSGQVIAGWDKGLTRMCIGEKRKLTIPSELAYGDKGAGGIIPPKATLVFFTELVGIKGFKPNSKDEL